MQRDRRGTERFAYPIPIAVDGVEVGVIHDLSSTGVAFSAPRAYMAGTRVDLLIPDQTPGRRDALLQADAVIVRWDPAEGGYTIGARLVTPFTSVRTG